MFIKIWCIKVTFVGVSTLPKYQFLVNQSLEVEGLGSCILNIVSKNLDVKVWEHFNFNLFGCAGSSLWHIDFTSCSAQVLHRTQSQLPTAHI